MSILLSRSIRSSIWKSSRTSYVPSQALRSLVSSADNKKFSVRHFDNNYISIKDDQDNVVQFNNVFLRDACTSPESIDLHSQQKLFTTGEIAQDLQIAKEPRFALDPETNEEILEVVWSQNGKTHESKYSASFLKRYSNRLSRREGKFIQDKNVTWDKARITRDLESLNVNYEDYLNDDKSFFKVLEALNKYGMAFVNNIPNPAATVGEEMTEQNSLEWPVAKLAERFGYIKKTFYGTLFDVKNVAEAKNIAYTNTFLPLHMDLCYYESPPGLQLLHAINNSTTGGENIFCDSFAAAKIIREQDPEAYLALTHVPITFHYDNNDEHYYYQRPLIVEDEFNINPSNGRNYIKEINYSPPFQGPYELGIVKSSKGSSHGIGHTSASENANHFLFLDFIRGMKMFEDLINNPDNHYQVKMKEGTCVIFDNRRTLHSRLEFSDENGGKRWLMGCYVDGDSFRSKLRVGYKKFT